MDGRLVETIALLVRAGSRFAIEAGRAWNEVYVPQTKKNQFNPAKYLSAAGVVGKTQHVKAKYIFFSQGGEANCVF